MKRLINLFLMAVTLLLLPACNGDPDFIKNAPPASGNGNETTEDDDSDNEEPAGDVVDPNFQIYLCFGQSNMEGNAAIEPQDLEDIDERFQMMAVVSDGWEREAGNWYTAIPPLCRHDTGLTPADYFGRKMIEELSKTNPDIKVGVIMVAIGGAGIKAFHKTEYISYYQAADAWQRSLMDCYDGYPYGKLVDMARKAQKQGVIKGILMHQGESDAFQDYWEGAVKDIYDNLISDLGLKAEETPFLVGEMCRDKLGVGYNDNKIPNLKNYISNCYVVSSENCPGKDDPTDDWHFSAEGYRELGRHYAETMISVLSNQEPVEPGDVSVPVNDDCFDFAKLNSDLEGLGRGSWNPETGLLTTSQWGIGGWKFDTPVDFTAHKYLVVEFKEAPTIYCQIAFYSDGRSVYDRSYCVGASKRVVVDTYGTYTTTSPSVEEDATLDMSSIKMFGIQTGGDATGVMIDRIYVTDENPDEVEEPVNPNDVLQIKEGAFVKLSGPETVTIDYNTKTVTGAGGWSVNGWQLTEPLDLKGKGFLVAKFSQLESPNPYLIIGNQNVWGEAYQSSEASQATDGNWYSVIDLSNDITSNVNISVGTIYLDKLTMIGIQSPGADASVSYTLDSVYVSDTNPLE